jgi:hypothetical protein
MKKLLLLLLINAFIIPGFAIPKKKAELLMLSYQSVVNGKTRVGAPKMMLLCSAEASKSWIEKDSTRLLPAIATETSHIDFNKKKLTRWPDLRMGL